jgi:hypothetical protein
VPRLDENGKGVLGLGDDRAGVAELHHVAHPEPVLRIVRLVFFVDALPTVALGVASPSDPRRPPLPPPGLGHDQVEVERGTICGTRRPLSGRSVKVAN